MKRTFATLLALTAVFAARAAEPAVENALRAKPESVEAWKDMRFGMFICWGPVTLTGREIEAFHLYEK